MKAEAFTGAARGVNADHYATENKAFITAAVFSSTVNLAKKKCCGSVFSKHTHRVQNQLFKFSTEGSLNENTLHLEGLWSIQCRIPDVQNQLAPVDLDL